MKRVAAIMVFAAFLGGCATYYDHPTKKTSAEFNRDKRDCERIAEPAAQRKHTRVCDEVDACLLSKGWRK